MSNYAIVFAIGFACGVIAAAAFVGALSILKSLFKPQVNVTVDWETIGPRMAEVVSQVAVHRTVMVDWGMIHAIIAGEGLMLIQKQTDAEPIARKQ